jgi:hypothetical protein
MRCHKESLAYLDIVVEDEMALPVLLEQVKGVVVGEVFELHGQRSKRTSISDPG